MFRYDFKDIKRIQNNYINHFNQTVKITYSLKYAVYIFGKKFYFWFVTNKEHQGIEYDYESSLIKDYNSFSNSKIKKIIKTVIK